MYSDQISTKARQYSFLQFVLLLLVSSLSTQTKYIALVGTRRSQLLGMASQTAGNRSFK